MVAGQARMILAVAGQPHLLLAVSGQARELLAGPEQQAHNVLLRKSEVCNVYGDGIFSLNIEGVKRFATILSAEHVTVLDTLNKCA